MAIGTATAIALGVSAAASTAQAVSGAARASKAKKASLQALRLCVPEVLEVL
jgi:hypothetical protein